MNSEQHALKSNLFDYYKAENEKKPQQSQYIDVEMCECNAAPDLINYIFSSIFVTNV